MKKRLSLLLVLVLLMTAVLTFTACSKGRTEEQIFESGEIVIGIDPEFPPMGYKEGEEIVGFDIDVAKAVAKELGLKAKFQPITWATKEAELNKGTIDLIWNGYTITDERAKKVLFSVPYLKNQQVIVMRKTDAESFNPNDFDKKKIQAQVGSTAVDAIKDKWAELKDKTIPGNDSNTVLLEELMDDKKDGFYLVIDRVVAEHMLKQNSKSGKKFSDKLTIIKNKSNGKAFYIADEEYGVGIYKKNSGLKEKIDKALQKLCTRTDIDTPSEYEKIYKKWFPDDEKQELNLINIIITNK